MRLRSSVRFWRPVDEVQAALTTSDKSDPNDLEGGVLLTHRKEIIDFQLDPFRLRKCIYHARPKLHLDN